MKTDIVEKALAVLTEADATITALRVDLAKARQLHTADVIEIRSLQSDLAKALAAGDEE